MHDLIPLFILSNGVANMKRRYSNCWGRCDEGGLVRCWSGCDTMWPLWKAVWHFLKMLNINSPCDLEILILDVHARETKTDLHKDLCECSLHYL